MSTSEPTPGIWQAQTFTDMLGRETGILWIEIDGKPKAYVFDNPADAYVCAAAKELLEGAKDTVEALKLLKFGCLIGKVDPKAIKLIDAHIDELNFAIEKTRGGEA